MAEFTGLIGTPSSGFTAKVVYSISQSITNNTSTVTAYGYVCKNNSSYYPYNGTSYVSMTINGNTGTATPSYNFGGVSVGDYVHFITYTSPPITHNADGTKSVTISFSVDGKLSSYYPYGTISKTITLPTIPRASSISSVSGNTIGEEITVNITRNSTSFTHQLWYKVGNSNWVDLGTGISTSKTFTIDMDMCSQITTSTSGNLQLCLRTYNGTSQIGSDLYKNYTVNVPNSVVPLISSIETSETVSGLNEKFGVYIQGKSMPQISISAEGSYGSVISNYSTVVDSITYSGNLFVCNIINKSGTITIKTTVTDSRGRTTTLSTEMTYVEYIPPSLLKFYVERCNESGVVVNNGTYVKIVVNGSIANCNNKNDNLYTIEYKKPSDANWTKLLTGNTYELNLETTETIDGGFLTSNTYDFKITYKDYFTSTSSSRSIPTEFTLINYNVSGKGFAVGKMSEKDAFEVGMDAEFNGNLKLKGVDLSTIVASENEPEQSNSSLWLKITSSVSDTIKDFMLHLKESTGYVLYRLSAQCVAMDNGNNLQTEIDVINNKLSEIKITKKSYAMTLEYSTYTKSNLGYVEIPQSDMDELGTPIAAMFKGGSSAPGNAYVHAANDGKTYGYASCCDADGTLIVTFFKGGV